MNDLASRDNFKVLVGGAFLLATNAGYIAALSFNSIHKSAVAHITGNVVRNAAFFVKGDFGEAEIYFLLWMNFFFGSTFGTILVSGTKKFEIRRVYGWALMIESMILLISYFYCDSESLLSDYLAAFACGIQNALCTSYSGAVIRTTHLTGTVTDIGMGTGYT
jgi:uncharacterized membrane protein YoaK (UPF0700 family)